MNHNKYILLFNVILIFISCDDETNSGTDPVPINHLEIQANILNGTWTLDQIKDKMSIKELIPVTMDGKEVFMFDDMTLTISEGSESGGIYSTLNTYDEKIWSSSGTWIFQNNDKNKILRSDGISMSILTDRIHNYAQPKRYFLRINFTTSDDNKEVEWVFNFVRECSSPYNEDC